MHSANAPIKQEMYTVFVVDDEPIIRSGLSSMIARSGCPFQVIGEASSGAAAIKEIALRHPHVVISDICMADMSGLELAEYLRKNCPNIITVILSGYSEFRFAQAAIQSKVFSYLLKPLGIEDVRVLLASLAKEIEKNRKEYSRQNKLSQQAAGQISLLFSLVKQQELAMKAESLQTAEVHHILSEIMQHMRENQLSLEQQKYLGEEVLCFVVRLIAAIKPEEKAAVIQMLRTAEAFAPVLSSEELERALWRQADVLMDHIRKGGSWNQQITIERMKQYIVDHYAEKLSLSVLADEFGFNPYYLSNLFKELGGQNFLEYVNQVRIGKAIELLKDRKNKIRDVAVLTGYENVNSFTRAFKKVVGHTPNDYRKRLQPRPQEKGEQQ